MFKMFICLGIKRFSEFESNDGMLNCKLVDIFVVSNKMLRIWIIFLEYNYMVIFSICEKGK